LAEKPLVFRFPLGNVAFVASALRDAGDANVGWPKQKIYTNSESAVDSYAKTLRQLRCQQTPLMIKSFLFSVFCYCYCYCDYGLFCWCCHLWVLLLCWLILQLVAAVTRKKNGLSYYSLIKLSLYMKNLKITF